MDETDLQETKKIMLMGLDNSGKTSILFNLKKGTNILSVYSMIPTVGLHVVNFEDEGTKFFVWDIGGQEKFRADFIENMDDYTLEVDEVIFVIDVQDIERYETSLEYLTKIVDGIKKDEHEDVVFSIFLHKYAPDLDKNRNYSSENLKKNLLDKIQRIIGNKFKYQIYKTRVYTVLEKLPFDL